MKEHIKLYKCIPDELCNRVLEFSKKATWANHHWSDSRGENVKVHNPDELEVCSLGGHFLEPELTESCISAAEQYQKNYPYLPGELGTLSSIRLNRYRSGMLMKPHIDHIRSLFWGESKGIPIISIVGLLNDDYEGGELLFDLPNETYKIKPVKGSIVVFPSNFLYPHSVCSVTRGCRHSFVAWAW